MPVQNLTPDELLTTTRAVRKRMDFSRPVEREVIEECLAIAQQAPTGSNAQGWHFVVVTEADKRKKLAEFYLKVWNNYVNSSVSAGNLQYASPERNATQARVVSSAQYLADHLQDAPVHVIPCIQGRVEGQPSMMAVSLMGSILPAVWSFMLAARARGLGTSWTTLHLGYEKQAAELLGIPYAEVTQAALIPVAYTKGSDFKPAPREPLSTMVHWENW